MRKSKILLSIITVFLLILLPSCESPLDYRIGQEGTGIIDVEYLYRGGVFIIELEYDQDNPEVDRTVFRGRYDMDFDNEILYLYPYTDNYPEWESVYALKKGVVK